MRSFSIGLFEPEAELLERLRALFGLHELALEDAHKAYQRPKLDRSGEMLFDVLDRVPFQEGEPTRGKTHLFVSPRFLISVHHVASLSSAPVRARRKADPPLLRHGPAFALYAIGDFLLDQYLPVAESCERELERLEESIFQQAMSRASPRSRSACSSSSSGWRRCKACSPSSPAATSPSCRRRCSPTS